MNTHGIRVLEYDHFLDMLAGYAVSEPGRAAVRALRPATKLADAVPCRRLCGDCVALRRAGVALPLVSFESPEPVLQRVAPERALLDVPDFLAIQVLLRHVDSVREIEKQTAAHNAIALGDLVRDLDPAADLADRLAAVLDPRSGQIGDRASDRLRLIRGRLGSMRQRIERSLEAMFGREEFSGAFQEDFVTTRHDRYVLPVRREERSRVRGILHDQSNSGETLFIEPEALVETGNELEELRLAERDEIRRILLELGNVLRENSGALRKNAELLARYDMACAVSAWAIEDQCEFPRPSDHIRFVSARHPLLLRFFKSESRLDELVPLDLDIPRGKSVIVITGSNTGGKTVVLKTIGLLTLIAQTGLPIPASGETTFRAFASVVADIGDEQSLQQNLSTFSGHTRQVVDILEAARREEALVLLDELGAGTDPGEGGALGCAILEALSRCSGLTLATTHLGSVKTFVFNHAAMENASMIFNVHTLRPEYRIEIGQAGASYALTIAARCGMPAEIVEQARNLLTSEQVELESVLSKLDEKHVRMREETAAMKAAREEADRIRDEAAQTRDRLRKELKDLHSRQRHVLAEAQSEAAALVAKARLDMERLLSAADRKPGLEEARAIRRAVETQAAGLKQAMDGTREEPEDRLPAAELRPGLRVWIPALNDHGTILSPAEGRRKVSVQVGKLTADVEAATLCRARAPEAKEKPQKAVAWNRQPRPDAGRELVLVGQRVDEAMSRLDKFLDAALATGLDAVRIVHGYGTGVLREAVHRRLRECGFRDFRLGRDGDEPGGSDVTHLRLDR